jgi:transcriptional regulator with XRE-family HTH domain
MTKKLTRLQVTELTQRILSQGLSLENMGQIAGVPPGVIVHIMTGQLMPSDDIRWRLAKALGIDPEKI